MKGIIFSEFLEMVEQKFGFETIDHIIENSSLPSGGSYTAVGTYPHSEMVSLVVTLSQKTGLSVPQLLNAYGEHQFGRFVELYPGFFEGVTSAFDFLGGIENYIHPEVRKLYPDAELPRFIIEQVDEHTLRMVYHSERQLEDFAAGLIRGCLKHFNENASFEQQPLPDGNGIVFQITRT